MTAKNRRIYEHLDKVIVTKESIGRIGYVVADRRGNTGIYGSGMWQVRIAYDLEDAHEHRSKLTNYDYILPYSDELWAAFVRLDAMRTHLINLFTELRKGKIPVDLQPIVQGDLFAQENTHPIERE